MRLDLFINKGANLKAENNLLKFAVVVIGLVVIFNSVMIHIAMRRQTVVLIPPGLDKKVDVSGGLPSEEYVRAWTRYVTNLALTYSPADVRSRFDDLLTLFAAESYKDYYKAFYDLASTVEAKNVSSVFYINQPIHVDMRAKTIQVEGLVRRYKDNAKLEEAAKKYFITYEAEDSRLKIVRFDEKENK